ncbi:unnamed protein product [marine sediment metagenome]|uniref:Uncharacterized protein n=1 Tax=marine sediment metagenome TaxID=412755 RepID=X1PDJ6_9ZZZZ
MQEAAEKVGVDFNTNVATNEHYKIIEIVVGELLKSCLNSIARVVKEVEVILISSLPPEKVCKLFFIPMENISQDIEYV